MSFVVNLSTKMRDDLERYLFLQPDARSWSIILFVTARFF